MIDATPIVEDVRIVGASVGVTIDGALASPMLEGVEVLDCTESVLMTNGADAVIADSRVAATGSGQVRGGIRVCAGCSLDMSGTLVEHIWGSSVWGDGAGLAVDGPGAVVQVSDSSFRNIDVHTRGAVAVESESSLSLTDVEFQSCTTLSTVYETVGLYDAGDGLSSIDGVTCRENEGLCLELNTHGLLVTGLYGYDNLGDVASTGDPSINLTIDGGVLERNDGGLFFDTSGAGSGGVIELLNLEFRDHLVTPVRTYDWNLGSRIDGCTFENNTGADYGGAVFAELGLLEIRNSVFQGNSALFDGGLCMGIP